MSAKDGGPAFPTTSYAMPNQLTGGLSLRDYFAGKALVGLVAGPTGSNLTAAWCYEMADAMIAERAK